MKTKSFILIACFLSIFNSIQTYAFELIVVVPRDAEISWNRVLRACGGTLKDKSFYSNTQLWSFPDRATFSLSGVSYSYVDSISGADRVRAGMSMGVGTLPIEIIFNRMIFLPINSLKAQLRTPKSPIPPFSFLPSCSKIDNNYSIKVGQKRVVKVAFIDSGVPCNKTGQTHQALKSVACYNEAERLSSSDVDGNGYMGDFMGWNFVSNNFIPNDDCGHGTATASIVWNQFAQVDGLKYLQIMPLKVLNKEGKGTLFNMIKAIDYATDKGVDIMNISITSQDARIYSRPTPIEHVINLAHKKGILVIAAAGNDGFNIDSYSHYVYPACSPNANLITVSASSCENNIASFANYGANHVDIFAPGENIEVLWIGTPPAGTYISAIVNGTSYSTPIVTGGAALLATHQGEKNPESIKKAILNGGVYKEYLIGKCISKSILNVPNALSTFER